MLFDVELMGINQAPPPQNVFKQIDIDSDNQLSKEEVQFFNQMAFFTFAYILFGVACFL